VRLAKRMAQASMQVLSHYWHEGSTGVSSVLARFAKATSDQRYLSLLADVEQNIVRPYVQFPGFFLGWSGMGNFMLDAYSLFGDAKYLRNASKVARGVIRCGVKKSQGIAFPGNQLYRFSTDFGTGSAGIALFRHRLMQAKVSTTGGPDFNFTIDQLLA